MKNKENAKMNTMRKTTKCVKKSKAKNREKMMKKRQRNDKNEETIYRAGSRDMIY